MYSETGVVQRDWRPGPRGLDVEDLVDGGLHQVPVCFRVGVVPLTILALPPLGAAAVAVHVAAGRPGTYVPPVLAGEVEDALVGRNTRHGQGGGVARWWR